LPIPFAPMQPLAGVGFAQLSVRGRVLAVSRGPVPADRHL